jgi:hypothetical protein
MFEKNCYCESIFLDLITSIRPLSGGGVRMLLGESSTLKLKGEGDEIDDISSGINPCSGIDIGVDIFCFRLGECIALLADLKLWLVWICGVLISIQIF